MPEPVTPTTVTTVSSNEPAATVTPPVTPPGTDPSSPAGDQGAKIDLSKLSDADFDKLYEDPRLYKHQRFSDLTEAKKERDALKKEKADAEKLRLEEQGKWEERAKIAEQEKTDAITKYETSKIETSIERAALKAGAHDAEAVLKLIDRTNVKVDPTTGQITGVEEAVKALIDSKPYLANKGGNAELGLPTNPGNANTIKKFKLSQLNDAQFYQKNQKEIEEARKNNQIEDDSGQ